MTKEYCNCNDVHHVGHDVSNYRHIDGYCIHPDGHTHKIMEDV